MKRNITIIASFIVLGIALASCKKDTTDYSRFYPNAIVTVKDATDGEMYLQLDDNTTLKPLNMTESPYDREVRALVNYTDKGEYQAGESGLEYDRSVELHWMDSVRTKMPVPTLGSEEDDKKYGTDPIEVIGNWVTVVEDGYLTLSFCAIWGNPYIAHSIDLVTGTDPEDPYVLELRHNSLEDFVDPYYGVKATGIIAFNIRELPDTGGETVKLKLKYRSFYGDREISFDYRTGGAASSAPVPSLEGVNTALAID